MSTQSSPAKTPNRRHGQRRSSFPSNAEHDCERRADGAFNQATVRCMVSGMLSVNDMKCRRSFTVPRVEDCSRFAPIPWPDMSLPRRASVRQLEKRPRVRTQVSRAERDKTTVAAGRLYKSKGGTSSLSATRIRPLFPQKLISEYAQTSDTADWFEIDDGNDKRFYLVKVALAARRRLR